MGRSTDSDIVPFVMHGVWDTEEIDQNLPMCAITDPEYTVERIFEHRDDDTFSPSVHAHVCTNINGWVLCGRHGDYSGPPEPGQIGKRKRIFPLTTWVRNDEYVYTVNEHFYSNGGGMYLALVADKRETLEDFWRDVMAEICGETMPAIDETDTVMQTM